MDIASPAVEPSLAVLHRFVTRHRRLFVLSGAGISIESGIPGYRNVDGEWKSAPPVFLQAFLGDSARRQRYWARSMAGWPVIARALPNVAHRALAQLQTLGGVERLVTQNVDGLHQRAGSTSVIELHGNVDSVQCIACNARSPRLAIQQRLERDNPDFRGKAAVPMPDGDAAQPPTDLSQFVVPPCAECGGILKPSVVFFGEGVPRDRVDEAKRALTDADAMLVVGSSLMVYSGYRFCEWAQTLGKPIAAINLGRTRADPLFAVKIERPCGTALSELLRALTGATA
jgi:NAD-dependent SIR2 family protein deacetylase